MKGQPFKELLLVGLFFLVLLIPMLRLTGLSADAPRLDAEQEQELSILRESWVTVRFAHPPELVVLTVNGIKVWTVVSPAKTSVDRSMLLPIEDDRVELLVQVKWPVGTPETVCELTLEPDGLEAQSISMWGEEVLDEIYSYHWAKH